MTNETKKMFDKLILTTEILSRRVAYQRVLEMILKKPSLDQLSKSILTECKCEMDLYKAAST